MNYDTAVKVYDAMRAGDAQLRMEVIRLAIRYARIRVDWQLAEMGVRREMDGSRSAAHNALIDAVNVLSRAMRAAGQDSEWRRLLTEDRKEIGDFACFLAAHLGVLAR